MKQNGGTHVLIVASHHLAVRHLWAKTELFWGGREEARQRTAGDLAAKATDGTGRSPGCRCSSGARWGRRSSPLGCWPRPPAAPRPAGIAPGPGRRTRSRTTGRRMTTRKRTGGSKTSCCFCKAGGEVHPQLNLPTLPSTETCWLN